MTPPASNIDPSMGQYLPNKAGNAMLGWMHEIAPFGIFTTDRELRIQSWNLWLSTHSGKTSAEMIGLKLTDVYPDVLSRGLGERFTHALSGEISVLSTALHRYLIPLPSPIGNGLTSHMLQTAMVAPLPAQDGSAVGTIAIIEDVTQREVQANILRRQQEIDRLLSLALATLLRSTEPAQEIGRIFSSLTVALRLDTYSAYLPTPDGTALVLQASGGILPKQQELLSRLPLEMGVRDKATRVMEAHASLIRSIGVKALWATPLELGDRLIGLIAFGSYENESIPAGDMITLGRIADYIAIALDRAAREREIVAASNAKDRFLAALSHELRTPLNPVLLLASEAKANPEFPAEARHTFQAIEKNVMLEARLIDDLLDLTRIAHGKVGLTVGMVDVHVAIRDAIANVTVELGERRMELRLELKATATQVSGDPVRLQQVFWNIIKNAIKFTPPGGTIWVRTVNKNAGEVAIEVADTGIGMDPSEITRVFDAFTQGDHAGHGHRFGGLGLGLAISRSLVVMHGGRIDAHSAGRNQGSSFWVCLPLATSNPTPELDALPSEVKPAAPSVKAEGQSRRAILLVEDHESTRNALQVLLRRRGFDVAVVATCEAARARASEQRFDLVLSDIGLPDGDGFELMSQLRDAYGLKGIALTGYGMEEDVARSGTSGFVEHLTKPVSVELLDRALAKAFALR